MSAPVSVAHIQKKKKKKKKKLEINSSLLDVTLKLKYAL